MASANPAWSSDRSWGAPSAARSLGLGEELFTETAERNADLSACPLRGRS
jgi:hypothetical protein